MSQSPRATTRPSPLAFARDVLTPAGPPVPLLGRARSRFVRSLPYVITGAFAVVLLGTTATVLSENYGLPSDLAFTFALLQAVPLLFAVRRPLLVWAIVFPADIAAAAALLALPMRGEQPWPWPPMAIFGMLLLMLLIGLRERRRTLVAVWTLTALASLVFQFVSPERSSLISVTTLVLGAVVLTVGGALRERGDARRALAEQETISEAERARRTLLEERTRIARELHDVVAHHMSVITVQADSAPYRLTGLPAEAEGEFASIAATARESLTEMRRLLGVLRSEDASGGEPGGVERAPQPGVERIPQLVEATVRAGLPVRLSMPDPLPEAVPQTVDLSAYRITQEALANVVRHAPGAATRVSVSVDPDRGSLMVLVVNTAPENDSPPLETSGTGHGLVGMRERVRLVGGTLDTGPLPDGGFRVAARLPFTTEEEPPTA
ncbi:histidine kinase [Streptomyces eurocidicus]|uniref:histidine kinase n=1 Tax=Streptomyces eurocidicus TaxID=66423 RepID=A0A2N8P2F0_STREU|nr:sensor histidine kinase [Streptomyces eurocidicus]MBB5121202.1 signal transduction histidine kinase [Streptomyces eurocidicus]MBF6054211.1 sensor histidine kinase [Streptomyces eurocidicus]PNE35192.1 histidine kinase [Streptomyces eurocidicus]